MKAEPATWRVFCCQRAGKSLDKRSGMMIEENYISNEYTYSIPSMKPAYNTKSGLPPWRPSLYDGETTCQLAYEALAAGGSYAKVAVALGVCKETVFGWIKKYQEFSDAVKIGLAVAESQWEEPEFHPDMNPVRYRMNMQNRFGWRDKIDSEITGKDGGPIQFKSAEEMSDDELASIIAAGDQSKPKE